ncbi:HipA domain-containing protein [Salinibacterium sp. TMP30]|uniref:type II toxin-antitoxin system HipA family toxin n=1 Tax=Salinibacterium sp. TMP30 TaxID=3138237 RepID=UPI003139189C
MVELAVELYGQRFGVISGDNYRSFDITFDPSAIATFGANSRMLSMAVPLALQPKRSLARRRRNYFAGLLPEGTQLESMARNAQLNEFDVLGLLARYGRDVAGAIQIWDINDPSEPRTPKAVPVTASEVSHMLKDFAGQPLGNARRGGKTSLPGVQPKIVLAQTTTGWARVEDGYPSTHILKPVVEKYPTMIFDEEYGSRFVRALKLAGFGSTLQQFDGTEALVIERYDRSTSAPDGRIHQEDLAQALGVPTIEKYEKYGAVTLERLSRLLAETDERNPWLTLAKMLTLSVAVGNLDMHAKNMSLLHPADGTVTIAPMYDVVPQTQYDTDGEFAFRVNGKLDHASITKADIVDEVTKWGTGRAETVVNETLEFVRDMAATETPHPSAEPSLQERIHRFSQNLLDNRMVGA